MLRRIVFVDIVPAKDLEKEYAVRRKYAKSEESNRMRNRRIEIALSYTGTFLGEKFYRSI